MRASRSWNWAAPTRPKVSQKSCVCIAPLGRPVVPEVYWMFMRSWWATGAAGGSSVDAASTRLSQ